MVISSKKHLVWVLSLILLAAFSAIILVNYYSARNSMRSEIVRSSLPLLRENIYSMILRDLLPSMHVASLMSNDDFLAGWVENGEKDIDAITGYLERIRREYGFHSTFFVSEGTGRYFHPAGILKTISPEDSHDIWYYDFTASGKEFDLDVDNDEASNNLLSIFINYRLENRSGSLLGVTGVGIEMNGFSDFLASQQEMFNRVIYLVDDSGVIQAHSDLSRVEQVDIHHSEGIGSIAGDILNQSTEAYSGSYRIGGKTVMITSRHIPEIDWYVLVEHDQHAAMADIRRHLYESLAIGFTAFVLVLGLTIVTINRYDSRMENMIITDVLTGASNRRALEAALPRMLYRRQRQESSVSILVVDLDRFKDLNDQFGHHTGDEVLRNFTDIVTDFIQPDDLLVRWGGDEFIIVSETDIVKAESLAQGIRKRFSESEKRVTLSIGIAEADDNDNIESLMKKADTALYEAKNSGRNRVAVHEGGEQQA